ncbi:helix-turn-helix domain-containing protein [Bathymodiolus heckerae thiotrophic gill symbiont]|uniref:helix-turn-helix domain-containing protein n=1 Tax=Bathymodiolus heckerae thiotrophic gill symbiont TaxID=1052212 RepID=UPI001485741A
MELTSSQINKNVSDTIKFHRIQRRLSLSELGRMINITQQQMSRYELNISQLNVVYLYKLSKVFDIDTCSFYTNRDLCINRDD